MSAGDAVIVRPHHKKVGPCYTRPVYRDGKRKTAIKVFTVLDESCYLLLFGIPSLNLTENLRKKCKDFGSVESVVLLPNYPDKEVFTEVFLVKFSELRSARNAKRKLDTTTFYGGAIHICYAPEYESVAECRLKLYNFRKTNSHLSRKFEHDYFKRLSVPTATSVSGFSSESRPSDTSLSDCDKNINTSLQSSSISCISNVSTNLDNCTHAFGDAIDEARMYWKNMGCAYYTDYVHSTFKATQSFSSTLTPSTSNQNLNDILPSRSTFHKKTIPLPVLQALSCRQYDENMKMEEPSSKSSHKPVENKKYDLFVPRSLIKRKRSSSLKSIKKSSDSKSLGSEVLPTPTLTVSDLRRLGSVLGPEQGPRISAGGKPPQTKRLKRN